MDEYTREPCPMRIFDDIGGAFAMGAIGGSIFHSISGFRNSAKGQRMLGMYRNAILRAPITGGQFAAWGGMFSAIDCTLVAIRKKEDFWNAVISGGATGALLTIRQGPQTMAVSAGVGAILLAMIEGVGVIMTRMSASQFDPTQAPPIEDPAVLGEKPSTSSSGGLWSSLVGSGDSDPLAYKPQQSGPAPLDLDVNLGHEPTMLSNAPTATSTVPSGISTTMQQQSTQSWGEWLASPFTGWSSGATPPPANQPM